LWHVWTIAIIMLGLLGGIYAGVITATEAGAAGVILTLLVAVLAYKYRFGHLKRSMSEAATATGMIGIMLIASTLFSFFTAQTGMIQAISKAILSSGLSPIMVIIGINIILLALGCVMDGLSLLLVSMPFFIPLVSALGFDLVWFGVLVTVNIEIGLITPPVGINLFLTSGTFNIPVGEIIRGSLPYVGVLIIFLAILVAFPDLALWLPGLMKG